MGQKALRSSGTVVSHEPPTSLHFDPLESHLLSFGIDYQTSQRLSKQTLPATAVNSARQVMETFIELGMIPQTNAQLYAASKELDQCTLNGIKTNFQGCLEKVGANGIFVFLFSGHGFKVENSEWVLAPADFDYTQATFLNSEVLHQWLKEIECKAKHILFILNCCYAGGIATQLTAFTDLPVNGSFTVLSACTADQRSLLIGPLEQSIFTFFLSHTLKTFSRESMETATPNTAELPLRKVFNVCYSCSKALGSLMINDSPDMRGRDIEPQVAVVFKKPVAKGTEKSRVESDSSSFCYAYDLYDSRSGIPIPQLEDVTLRIIGRWLLPDGPLSELKKCDVLSDKVLAAALCSMMYSVALIECSCDSGEEKVTNVNLSITAFLQVATALNEMVTGVEIPKSVFFMSWLFYIKALTTKNVNISGFLPLHQILQNDKLYYEKPHYYQMSHNSSKGSTPVNSRVSNAVYNISVYIKQCMHVKMIRISMTTIC